MAASKKVEDWADREALRLFELTCELLAARDDAKNEITFEIASSLRRAAHNPLMFDATKGIKGAK